MSHHQLFRACADGDTVAAASLLEASPALVDEVGDNPYWAGRFQPLHLATTWGQEAIVALLVAAGADPNGENEGYGGWSPLMIANQRGHTRIADRLLEAGATVGPYEAAGLGRVDELRVMLDADPALVSGSTSDGTTLLHLAHDAPTAEALLQRGADLERSDTYGGRPLDAAVVRAGRDDRDGRGVAESLLAAGAVADASVVAALGDIEDLAARVEADPQALHRKGLSGAAPLHAAVSCGRSATVDWLLAQGADPEAPDSGGIFPLHHVARAPHHGVAIANSLLEAGANPRVRDGLHEATPASWAEFQRRTDLVSLFEGVDTEG